MPQLSHADLPLLAMAYLLAKHLVADFVLQTKYQWQNKGRWGHPGGLLHAAIHAVLTLLVFFIVTPSSTAAAATIVAAEYVVHYHIDWLKERIVRLRAWTAADTFFWWALGVDQFAHGLTYVTIVWCLLHGV